MRLLLAGLCLALFALASPIQGQEAPCAPLARLTATILQAGGKVSRPLEGEDAKRFMAALNASEPPTDFKADQVVFVLDPRDREHIVAMLVEAGSVCKAVRMSPDAFAAILEAAQKGPGETL